MKSPIQTSTTVTTTTPTSPTTPTPSTNPTSLTITTTTMTTTTPTTPTTPTTTTVTMTSTTPTTPATADSTPTRPRRVSSPSGLSCNSSAIMSSIHPVSGFYQPQPLPTYNSAPAAEASLHTQLSSISLKAMDTGPFKLIDEDETLLVDKGNVLLHHMGLDRGVHHRVKVVTVVGGAGEGKSYALNQLFFHGKSVFSTTNSSSGSVRADTGWWSSGKGGVWAAYGDSGVLLLDPPPYTPAAAPTPALDVANRTVLKVMAVSDLIIVRTRVERLQSDLYEFLAGFSAAYTRYVKEVVAEYGGEAGRRFAAGDGPALIILHDTRHTAVMTTNSKGTPEEQIRAQFSAYGLTADCFSSLHYVGSCANGGGASGNGGDNSGLDCFDDGVAFGDSASSPGVYSNRRGIAGYNAFGGASVGNWRQHPCGRGSEEDPAFDTVKEIVKQILSKGNGRRGRKPEHVLDVLKLLSSKYSDELRRPATVTKFPDKLLSCQSVCIVCSVQCCRAMNHQRYPIPSSKNNSENNTGNKPVAPNRNTPVLKPAPDLLSSTRIDSLTDNENGILSSNSTLNDSDTSRGRCCSDSDDCKCNSCTKSDINYSLQIISSVPKYSGNEQSWQRLSKAVPGSEHEYSHASVATQCNFSEVYQNKRFLCVACLKRGEKCVVTHRTYDDKDGVLSGVTTYVWSGWVLNCPSCGIIYRSRPNWVFNSDPDSNIVEVEHLHVWQAGQALGCSSAPHPARQMLEGFTAIQSSVSSLAANMPVSGLASWLSTTVNPPYWKPDVHCTHCETCSVPLRSIHHCRRCGGGFCQACSSRTDLVPERGWGNTQAVRVCDGCNTAYGTKNASSEQVSLSPTECSVGPRQVTEFCRSFISAAGATAADIIRTSTRPDYWQPDDEMSECKVCKRAFDGAIQSPSVSKELMTCGSRHHCRACGYGVCDACSPHRVPVRERGWESAVRVCEDCHSVRVLVDYQE